jgi:hypothetical protein
VPSPALRDLYLTVLQRQDGQYRAAVRRQRPRCARSGSLASAAVRDHQADMAPTCASLAECSQGPHCPCPEIADDAGMLG